MDHTLSNSGPRGTRIIHLYIYSFNQNSHIGMVYIYEYWHDSTHTSLPQIHHHNI